MNKAHLTAITRNKMSAPVRCLIEKGLIKPQHKVLDYGCGKGFDADQQGWDKYDPHFFPVAPRKSHYDIVICQYVLNVIEDPIDRQKAIEGAVSHIKKAFTACFPNGGMAIQDAGTGFFIVRDDVKQDGYTSKGTWQGTINLDDQMELIAHKKGGYKIYKY